MSRHPPIYQWAEELASRFDGLSPVSASLLALWSVGMTLARTCGLTTVANRLAKPLGKSHNTQRQRLREFYQEAPAKAGAKRGGKRRDFDVTGTFAPLLRWALSRWPCQRLALALDVTNLGSRFQVLCASVLYGGIGLPVAWKVLPANQKGSWHGRWCALLGHLRPVVPADWTVVVLSDRGLESARLFREVVGANWHPLMRVKAAGLFRPAGWMRWYRFDRLVPAVGRRFTATGLAYKSAEESLAGTFLGCWEPGHAEPWLLLTDLTARAAPSWYAFRAWVEQGFKVIKGGGLQWQHTRMTKAERAERLWLAIAVAVLWMVLIGAVVEGDRRKETIGTVGGQARRPAPRRRQRLFREGIAAWLAAWLNGVLMPIPDRFPNEPWSEAWHDAPALTEEEFCT
jgi:hypothetical protein